MKWKESEKRSSEVKLMKYPLYNYRNNQGLYISYQEIKKISQIGVLVMDLDKLFFIYLNIEKKVRFRTLGGGGLDTNVGHFHFMFIGLPALGAKLHI